MKLLLSIILLGLTLQANATTIIGQELEKYKRAVLNVDRFQENCPFDGKTNEGLLQKVIINDAESLEIIDGKQPLLVFTVLSASEEIEANNFKNEVIIMTDSSHMAIHAIEARNYKMTEVNHGDLENPNFSNELVLFGKAKCKNLEQPISENQL